MSATHCSVANCTPDAWRMRRRCSSQLLVALASVEFCVALPVSPPNRSHRHICPAYQVHPTDISIRQLTASVKGRRICSARCGDVATCACSGGRVGCHGLARVGTEG